MNEFELEVFQRVQENGKNEELTHAASEFVRASTRPKYSYNFTSLGRPIIQYPQDIVAMQELIWSTRPDIIIETGIAHGGSLILNASMLALLDYCEAIESGQMLDPSKPMRRVIGVDIDIRAHNRAAIEAHPLANRIDMIQGSSIDPAIVEQVRRKADGASRVLVSLDSNHTHDHVLAELHAYAPLVSQGSYCVVWDSGVEDLPADMCADRPWGKGDNPKTAVHAYLADQETANRQGTDGKQLKFEIDHVIEAKLMITAASDGFLKRI